MLTQIKEKCEKSGLQSKLTTRKIEFFDGSIEERTELFIQIPCEREFKTVILDQRNESLKEILESQFEKFKFLKGYEAVYSTELGIIECEIQSDDGIRPTGSLLRRLLRFLKPKKSEAELATIETEENESEKKDIKIEIPSPNERIKIYISESSTEFSFLSGGKRETFVFRGRLRPLLTLRIEGISFETHANAKDILSNLGNSVLFQIDLLTNIPAHIAYDRDLQREIRIRKKSTKEGFMLTQPKFQYDTETISLYWYARTAINMPLLQYLAFYQVLEFYFPKYSAKDAQDRIKNLLKDPTFDRNSDKNVSKILEIIKISAGGKAIGDERSQLRATIFSCIGTADLHEFFNEFEERKDFFDDQKKNKGLVSQKIGFSRKDYDVRIDISNRIYDLRCRIVHSKEDSESELLLPFSPDLTLIKYDIDLIEFIARKVLIAGSKPLEINF